MHSKGLLWNSGDLTTPIFKDRNFEMMFRLSRSRVQRIFEDDMQVNHPFYTSNVDATGKMGASLEAKVLLPLKTFCIQSGTTCVF